MNTPNKLTNSENPSAPPYRAGARAVAIAHLREHLHHLACDEGAERGAFPPACLDTIPRRSGFEDGCHAFWHSCHVLSMCCCGFLDPCSGFLHHYRVF